MSVLEGLEVMSLVYSNDDYIHYFASKSRGFVKIMSGRTGVPHSIQITSLKCTPSFENPAKPIQSDFYTALWSIGELREEVWGLIVDK